MSETLENLTSLPTDELQKEETPEEYSKNARLMELLVLLDQLEVAEDDLWFFMRSGIMVFPIAARDADLPAEVLEQMEAYAKILYESEQASAQEVGIEIEGPTVTFVREAASPLGAPAFVVGIDSNPDKMLYMLENVKDLRQAAKSIRAVSGKTPFALFFKANGDLKINELLEKIITEVLKEVPSIKIFKREGVGMILSSGLQITFTDAASA